MWPGAGVPRMRWIRHQKSWAKPFRVQAYREHDITWHNMIFLTTRLWGIILFWEFRHFLFFLGGILWVCLSPGLVCRQALLGHMAIAALGLDVHCRSRSMQKAQVEDASGSIGPLPQGAGFEKTLGSRKPAVWSSAVFWAVGWKMDF